MARRGASSRKKNQSRLTLNLASSSFSESYMKQHCMIPSTFLYKFLFACVSTSSSRPRGRDNLRKGREGRLGGVKTRLFSLSAALGNRKGSRLDFKAAVLAAIPELTLLDLTCMPFHFSAGWRCHFFPLQSPSSFFSATALCYLLSYHVTGRFRSLRRSLQDSIYILDEDNSFTTTG